MTDMVHCFFSLAVLFYLRLIFEYCFPLRSSLVSSIPYSVEVGLCHILGLSYSQAFNTFASQLPCLINRSLG